MVKKNKTASETASVQLRNATDLTFFVNILDAGRTLAEVQEFAVKVKKAGFQATIQQVDKKHCVLVGGFTNEESAKTYAEKVSKAGFKTETVTDV